MEAKTTSLAFYKRGRLQKEEKRGHKKRNLIKNRERGRRERRGEETTVAGLVQDHAD